MKLVPVDDIGESTGLAVVNNDYRLVPVDDSGEESKPPRTAGDIIKSVPGAIARAVVGSMGSKRPTPDAKGNINMLEALLPDNSSMQLPYGVGTDIGNRFKKEMFPGMSPTVDMLTDPRTWTQGAAVEGELPAVLSAEKNPNVMTTLLKSPKFFETQIGKSERANIDEAARLSNIIKEKNPLVKGINTKLYGDKLDSLNIPLTRGDLNDAHAFTLDEINGTGDPNLINTPGYKKLLAHANQLSPNTADVNSGLAKQAQVKVLNAKKNAGEFVTQDEYEALALTPEEKAAIKNPRHADDPIDARTLQQLRRELRGVSGSTPVSQHAANQFEFNLGLKGSQRNPDFAELNDLNTEYAPVISAQNKALREFSASDRYGITGEKSLRRMAKETHLNELSPTEAKYIDVLGSGSGDFSGLGPELPSSMSRMTANEARITKPKRLSEQNSKIKTLATMAGTGLGIFKAKLLQRVLGQ